MSLIVASTRPAQQRDRLGPALHRLHGRAALLRELVPVAREGLGGRLAGEVVEARDGVVVLGHDDDARRDGVRLAEEVLLLALGVDRDLVGDDVETAGLEPGEDRVPLRLLERDLEAELVGDGFGDLDVEADEIARSRRGS